LPKLDSLESQQARFKTGLRKVGPEHFGVISVDCAKRRSIWMLCDFYGKVIIEPTIVDHNAGGLKAMTDLARRTCQEQALTDSIVAVEMTGIYHRPVQLAFRKAGFDTRPVHPFASKHYRRPLHPDCKTDDNDLRPCLVMPTCLMRIISLTSQSRFMSR